MLRAKSDFIYLFYMARTIALSLVSGMMIYGDAGYSKYSHFLFCQCWALCIEETIYWVLFSFRVYQNLEVVTRDKKYYESHKKDLKI